MHAATLTAVVVLPTPPFWLAIAYTVPMATVDASGGTVGRAAESIGALERSQRALARHAGPARKARRASARPCGIRAASGRRRRDTGPRGRTSRRSRPRPPRPRAPSASSSAPRRPSTPPDARRSREQRRGVLARRPAAPRARGRSRVVARPRPPPSPPRALQRFDVAPGPTPQPPARGSGTCALALSTRTTRAPGSATASASPGNPAPEPRSAIGARRAHRGELERDERVGHVDVDRLGGVVDRGRRRRVAGLRARARPQRRSVLASGSAEREPLRRAAAASLERASRRGAARARARDVLGVALGHRPEALVRVAVQLAA